jgi:hypothetical protein
MSCGIQKNYWDSDIVYVLMRTVSNSVDLLVPNFRQRQASGTIMWVGVCSKRCLPVVVYIYVIYIMHLS